jgi:hypothetical protein
VSVTITQVKPDMIAAYQALLKAEGIPAEKKAGVAWRATYRPVFGELNTFVTVRPVTNYAQYDSPSPFTKVLGQEAASRYLARVQAMTTSQRRMIQTLQSDLSIESGMSAPASLVIVKDIKLLPGKGADWNQLVTSDVLPAYKKAGIKDVWVHTINFGGAQGRTVVQPIANLADIDGGTSTLAIMTRALGAEPAQRINQQLAAMTDTLESSVLRLIPDLSFSTTPAQRTSK